MPDLVGFVFELAMALQEGGARLCVGSVQDAEQILGLGFGMKIDCIVHDTKQSITLGM